MLVTYLSRVVGQEGDMAKAVAIIKWLYWLIGESDTGSSEQTLSPGMRVWNRVALRVREGVQNAVRDRGLGALDI